MEGVASEVAADARPSTGRLPRWAGVAAPLGLFVLGVAAFHKMLTPGWAVAGYDEIAYYYPFRHYLAQAWAQHHWIPLWTNQYLMGAPFLANIQSGVLYPANLLYAFLPTAVAMSWSIALHVGLLGAGMYLYARRGLGLGVAGAVTTAATFMLSGFVTAHNLHLNMTNSLAWAPWMMLGTDRTLARPSPLRVVLLALAFTMSLLAGNTNATYFACLFAVGAAIGRLLVMLKGRRFQAALWGSGACVAAALLGFGLSAAQLLPTFELTRHGFRSGGLSLEAAGSGAIRLSQLVGNVLPDYVNPQGTEQSASVGAAPLALAALVVAVRGRRFRVWVLCLLALVAALTAIGTPGHVFPLLHRLLPGYEYLRVPARAVVFSTVAEAILAGFGVETAIGLVRSARRPKWRHRAWAGLALAALICAVPLVALAANWLKGPSAGGLWHELPQPELGLNVVLLASFGLGALTLIGAGLLAGPRAARPIAIALPALVVADLLVAGAPTFGQQPLPADLYQYQGAGRALVSPSLNHRYLSLAAPDFQTPVPPDISGFQLPPGQSPALEGYLVNIERLSPNVGFGENRLTPVGYEQGVLPLKGYAAFRAPLLPPGTVAAPEYWDVITLTTKVWSPAWLKSTGTALVLTSNGADPNPPGCHCLVKVATRGPITAWRPTGPSPSRAWVDQGSGPSRAARITSDDGDRVVIHAPAGPGGRLVLADSYYPGWTATVNGRPVKVERYQSFLRSVRVPAGPATVVFTYRPLAFTVGAAVSIAALVLALILVLGSLVISRRRARRREPA